MVRHENARSTYARFMTFCPCLWLKFGRHHCTEDRSEVQIFHVRQFCMVNLIELKNGEFSEIATFNNLHEHISFQTTCNFLEYDVLEHEKWRLNPRISRRPKNWNFFRPLQGWQNLRFLEMEHFSSVCYRFSNRNPLNLNPSFSKNDTLSTPSSCPVNFYPT